MANKSIFQLPTSGALVSTDELEKQLTAGGASQKLTLAQLLTFIQNNATAFAQAAVAFANTVNVATIVNVGAGIQLAQDGSAVFAAGNLGISGLGNITNGTAFALNADGTATLGSGGIIIAIDGSVQIGAGAISLNAADGSAVFANANITMTAAGGILTPADIEITDTTKGFIAKSPNGTRYRIKVDNAGNLLTELA